MFEVATHLALLLILAAFVAGFVDSIAGGGGLIAMPMLLIAGATPLEALATNKLQGAFGAGTATVAYARAGHVRLKDQFGMAAVSALAAAAGALVAKSMPADALRIIMPVILVAVAAFFALKPGLSDRDRVQRLSPALFTFTAVPLIAAYDGFFGPGTGSFFMFLLVRYLGHDFLHASGSAKVLNVATNLGALVLFAATGHVWYLAAIPMALANIAGSYLGSHMAIKKGSAFVRGFFLLVLVALIAKMAHDIFLR